MKAKIKTTICLLFVTTFIFGQPASKDSISVLRDSLKSEIEKLNKLLINLKGCSDFELTDNPEWTNDIKTSKTYYQNCRWSGTYIVLNMDSTFLFKHNGEGSNYLQKGKWKVSNDSILTLESITKLTTDFKLKMKKIERRNYKSISSFRRQYFLRQNMLELIDN